MWHKIESVEEKYGISKFSIYALITQEPELRQYIKALEGVLQINDEGLEMLLALVKENGAKEEAAAKEEPAAEPDKVEILEEDIFEAPAPKEEVLPEEEAVVAEKITEAEEAVAEPQAEPPVESIHSEDFFEESPLKKELDFFSDIEEENAGEETPDVVTEITMPSEDDRDLSTLIKALKEKMIIQNEQIRALNEYLEVSRKILIQDEKIVTILESISTDNK